MIALVCGLCLASGARGDKKAMEEAKKHFDAATMAYNLGDFDKAAEEYKVTYQLRPHPSFLYNIAQSYRQAGNLEQALVFYRSFLRNDPKTTQRAEIEGRIVALEQQLADKKAEDERKAAAAAAAAAAPPAPAPAIATEVVATPPPVRKTPTYKKWWLWTTVGVIVVGAGVGVGLGLGLKPSLPSAHFGTKEAL
jgi:tetratricopeptide (TPR) repeat protein